MLHPGPPTRAHALPGYGATSVLIDAAVTPGLDETGPLLIAVICHGKKGALHQAYRDEMEDWLGHRNLNVLDRYSFRAPVPAGGVLLALRAPDAAGLDDEDGAQD